MARQEGPPIVSAPSRRSPWKRRLAILLAVCALAAGGASYLSLWTDRWAEPLRPYQGTAIVGNSRMLVPLDSRGTLLGLFWPHVGEYQNMYNPPSWLGPDRATPSRTGAFLGVRRGNGPVRWLRNCRHISQRYAGDTNVLITRYIVGRGLAIEVQDFVLPGRDVMVRRVIRHGFSPGGLSLVAFQNLDLANARVDDHARYADGAITQWRDSPGVALAVAASAAPRAWHLGNPKALPDVRLGHLNNAASLPGPGDVATAMSWPLGDQLTLVYAAAPTPTAAEQQARQALARPGRALARDTRRYWQGWMREGDAPSFLDRRLQKLYRRSALVLKLCADDRTGAIIAGARSEWAYCWPRDGAYGAVAFDLTGHPEEARKFYRFLARMQSSPPPWPARYRADGQPTRRPRAPQVDAAGYLPWGVWVHTQLNDDPSFAREMYPAVRRAAEAILAVLDKETGLPGPGSDYWESSDHLTYYLSNAIVCAAGLAAAAELANLSAKPEDATRFRAGAARMRAGIERFLWDPDRRIYQRATTDYPGADVAACWAVSPFGVLPSNDARLLSTVMRLEKTMSGFGGGLTPGEDWTKPDPWIPSTLFDALYWRSLDRDRADARLTWVLGTATPAGTLPETFSPERGEPSSTTPLSWSHAIFIMAAYNRSAYRVPVPPFPTDDRETR
jgi:GH15 family glucan-1,4-alpha-glucosidase